MIKKDELLKQKKEIEDKLKALEYNNKIIINNTWDVTEYEKWYDNDYCFDAVKQNGYALQYVNKNIFDIK